MSEAATATEGGVRRLFSRDKTLIIVCAAIGAGIGAYRIWTMAPSYAASTRLYVEPADPFAGADLFGTQRGRAVGKEGAWSPPTDLLQGTEVAELAVQLAQLESVPCLANTPNLALDIVSHLKVTSTPSEAGKGHIQDVTFTCADPAAAKRVLEGVVAAYEVAAERWQMRRTEENLASLEKQRAVLLERFQEKQRELEAFEQSHPDLAAETGANMLDGRMQALVDARIRAELRRIDAEVRLAALQALEGGSETGADRTAEALLRLPPLEPAVPAKARPVGPGGAPGLSEPVGVGAAGGPAPGSAPAGRAIGEDIDLEAESQYVQQLETVWGPEHPKLQAAKARLADLERRAKRRYSRSVQMASAYLRLCQEEEARLQRAVESQRSVSFAGTDGNSTTINAQILRQVLDGTGEVLRAVCSRIEQLRLEIAAGGAGGVKVMSMVPPHARLVNTTDQRPKLFLVPAGMGLLIGLALTYLRGGSQPAPRGARGRAGAPAFRQARRRKSILGRVPSLPKAVGRGSQRALGTWVLREPESAGASLLRKLGGRLYRSAESRNARCVLLTSRSEGEGTSVVAANVAVSLAQRGRRVLLVDGNYSHPSQHVLLSDILSLSLSEDPDAQPLSPERLESGTAAMRTQLETLSVLPAWPPPDDPVGLLGGAPMRAFMTQAANRFELIVIDAPAVSEGEDAALLAEFADAVVPLVDGSRYADASAEARALQLAIDLPSLGVVINAVPSAGAARPVAAGGERLGTGPTDSLDEEPDDEAVPIFTEAESAGVGGTADAGPDERGSN